MTATLWPRARNLQKTQTTVPSVGRKWSLRGNFHALIYSISKYLNLLLSIVYKSLLSHWRSVVVLTNTRRHRGVVELPLLLAEMLLSFCYSVILSICIVVFSAIIYNNTCQYNWYTLCAKRFECFWS